MHTITTNNPRAINKNSHVHLQTLKVSDKDYKVIMFVFKIMKDMLEDICMKIT